MAVYTDEENVLEELFLTTNELGHRAAVALTAAVLPSLRQLHLDGNEFEFRDVQRLMDTFGDKLQEMGENDSLDGEEEESGEEEDEEEEEKEGGEEEEKEKEDDEFEPLTQFFSQNVIYD
jgi:Ran GTPase-activating protein (RanGAP) involved in mRNA processing and transport